MGLIDRFTRDERSAMVWWPFALLLIVLCIATFPGANRAAKAERSAAQERSVATLQGALVASIGSADLSAPLTADTAEVARATLHDSLTDARVNAIRLWAPDGSLLFSTLARDSVGSAAALNDAQVSAAAADPGQPVSVVSQRTLTGTPAPSTFQTYLGLVGTSRPVVGEVEFSEAALLSSVHAAWLWYRIILGIGGLLVLGMALLSTREPAATIGAGVRFYETSIPHGYVLVALDEQAEMGHSTANARARVTSIEARLRESEEARRGLEARLQHALSLIALRTHTGGVESVIPRPAATAPVDVKPPAPVVPVVPVEPKKVGPKPEPVARPTREPASPVSRPKPAVARQPVVIPEAAPDAEARPMRKSVADARPEPVAPESKGAAAKDPDVPKPVRTKKIVRLPDPDPGFVLRVADAVNDKSGEDESAVNVLERLVEAAPARGSNVDPSEVRVRLARLAASKKPRSRSEHRDPEHRSD